jgi:hypothetical protein
MMTHKDSSGAAMFVGQKNILLFLPLIMIFSMLSHFLMDRTLVPFMRGVSPISRLWNFPWGKKDTHFILMNIRLTGIFIAVFLVVSLVMLTAFRVSDIASAPALRIGIMVVGAIGSILLFTVAFIRYFFYCMSAYGENPLTLRECWQLMDKNVTKMGASVFLIFVVVGLITHCCFSYFYYIYPIFYALYQPVLCIFFVSVFLTLSKQKNIMEIGKAS